MIHAARPATGPRRARVSSSAIGNTNTQGQRAARDRAQRPRDELRGRLRLDPALDDTERPVEDPAEEAAGHVAEQAPEDPAEAVGLHSEAAGRPRSRPR